MTPLRRRISVLPLAAALPAWPQGTPPRRPLLAFLGGARYDASTQRHMTGPLEKGLRALGLVPGRQLDIAYRWAEGQLERLPALLAELLALNPTLLMTSGPRPALLAREAAVTLPVVAVAVDDPVVGGLAATYARPGGRFTGLSLAYDGILEKRLQRFIHRAQLGALTLRHRLPAVVGGSGYLDSLGIASYQGDFAELFSRAAALVDKILKGTPSGEIPWEQSTKMELVVNLKTARAFGLTLPQRLLVSADEVIE